MFEKFIALFASTKYFKTLRKKRLCFAKSKGPSALCNLSLLRTQNRMLGLTKRKSLSLLLILLLITLPFRWDLRDPITRQRDLQIIGQFPPAFLQILTSLHH